MTLSVGLRSASRRTGLRRAVFAVFALALLAVGMAARSPALASETITYTYDALGRLVKVDHGSAGPNAGSAASYAYDKAGNRCNVTVSTDGSGGTGSCTSGTALTLSPTTLPNGTVGTAYSRTITASGGTSPYTYSKTAGTLPAGLTLNSSTGVLSGTPTTASTYSFTITATDNASHTGSQAYTVTINSVTLTLSPTTLPNGTVGTSYSRTITTSGGTSPYTYSKTTGTLPTGLSLNSGGLLSGTPTTAATYSFTITATDSASHTGSQAYTLTVNSGVTLTLSPTTLSNGTVGTSYSQTITTSGGTSPYTYSKTAGTLPAGLSLSSGGVLSGTPTTASTYSFTITATDSASHTGNRAYSVTINSAGTCSGVSFSVNDVAAIEADLLSFIVTKTGSSSISCSVTYATADGTAVAPGDYAALSAALLTFTSAQTSKTVNVSTYSNGVNPEPDETMYLNLSAPTGGATISDPQGVGTIVDDGLGGGGQCNPVCP